MCFAFGLSSRTSPTANEFLWNVCRINGFNFRVASDVIFYYALERGEPYSYVYCKNAKSCACEGKCEHKESSKSIPLIQRFEKDTENVVPPLSHITKGTNILWEEFSDLEDMGEKEFYDALLDNKYEFKGYNKTAKREFVALHNELESMITAQIEDYNAKKIKTDKAYNTGTPRKVNILAEIIFDELFHPNLAHNRVRIPDTQEPVWRELLDNIPLEEDITEMQSTSVGNIARNTDLERGHARKTFVLCFFARFLMKWESENEKSEIEQEGRQYRKFYRALNKKLNDCSYGLLFPAHPFDWLILNCIRALDSTSSSNKEVVDILEFFNDVLAKGIREQPGDKEELS
jgi:hypothetical protein